MYRRFWMVAGLALLAAMTGAQPVTYAQRGTEIRAGVLLVDSNKLPVINVPANDTPHVWFNLDSNRAVKPAGLNIYNPRASSQVSAAVETRWTLIASQVGGTAPAAGQRITKRDAAYWEVPLSAVGDQELSDYDVLLLSGYRLVSLNPIEREKLRRFMDLGGVLWVDFAQGATLDGINSFPVPFQLNATNLGLVRNADYFHPLLSYPNAVTEQNLAAMETDGALGLVLTTLASQGIGQLEPILSPLETDSLKIRSVVQDERGVSVGAAKVGDGYFVVTTHGVATALNRVVNAAGNYDVNNRYQAADPTADRSAEGASKLALNMASLRSANTQPGAGSRKAGTTPVDIGAPLLQRFEATLNRSASNLVHSPPIVFKGVVVMTSDDRVYVYDANPASDLDGDGNPDDGIADYSTGSNLDLVWVSAPMASPISSPTAFEIPNPRNGVPRDQVVVQDASGRLNAFDLFPLNANGQIQPLANAPTSYQLSGPGGPSSWDLGLPAAGHTRPRCEGLLYVADTQDTGFNKIGRVWVADPSVGLNVSTTGTSWSVGGAGTNFIGDPSWSPTVGYLQIQDSSGGLDKVMYVPTRPNPAIPGPNTTAGITSLWLGVRGERVSRPEVNGNQLELPTRASLQGLDIFLPGADFKQLGVKLTMVHSNGDPYTATEMADRFTGRITQFQGRLNAELTPAGVGLVTNEIDASLPSPATVRVDYQIDWGTGQPNVTAQIIRGQLFLPDNANKNRRIIHGIAMGPDGSIYVAHSNQISGGAFYALREEGRGTFKLRYRYDMYREHSIRLNQAQPQMYSETLFDTDDLTTLPGIGALLGGPIQQLHFDGGPIVRDGVVYVVGGGHKGTGFVQVPLSIILAFKADPAAVEIRTGDLAPGFSIVQPDIARSTNQAMPEVFNTLQPNQFVYERQRGASSGTIRIDNLMATTRGPMLNALSTSQPIIIRRSGQPDVLIEPDRNGSTWSPLSWYIVLHGLRNHSPSFVSGNTLFVTGSSSLPSIVTTGSPFPERGIIMGMDAQITPNDPFLFSNSARPWLHQLYQLRNSGGLQPNPDIRWPQAAGVDSFETWRVRLLQTLLGNSTDSEGVIGGDGTLVAWSDDGLFGFSRQDFLVCDEGRLLKVDPSGNPLWTSDTTLNSGIALDVNAAGNARPLVRPTKAYPVGQNGTLIVDTGANRVVRIDSAGREVRSIEALSLDPTYRPEGFQANESELLRQPRDVLTYTTYESSPPLSNSRPLEYWVHYLIADSGNNRLVELIDRYDVDPATRRIRGVILDANNNRALGVLWWHSPANVSGKQFAYNGLARVFNQATGRYVYAASIGGSLPTRVDSGLDAPSTDPRFVRENSTGNGGVVLFDGTGTVVVNEIVVPEVGPNVYWNEGASLSFNSPPVPMHAKKLTNVNSVTMRYVNSGAGPEIAMMITDSTGVYEVVERADPRPPLTQDPSGKAWVVRWMLPREAYRVIRRFNAPVGQPWLGVPTASNPRDFRPAYARRLDSGQVLVVNSWGGLTRGGGSYQGEVLEIEGGVDASETNSVLGFGFTKVNLGFYSSSIRAELPPVQGARGLVIPVFADRR
ncbi:MAG: hypothetical protein H6534_09300 [Chthonomonadaceae bacterium]|nr:hypothetical protein [Chthonomonadaceae bacterium]